MASKRDYFYHGSIKRYTAVFSSLFADITIKKKTRNGEDMFLEVPVRFAQKQKSRDINKNYPELEGKSNGGFSKPSTMISYEIIDMQYATERMTSQFNKFAKDNVGSFNRTPYDITYNVHVSADKLNDGFQIIEQIIPFFTPSINVQIDEGVFGICNVPISLLAVSSNIDYSGLVSDKRIIEFTMIFVVRGWLYRDTATAHRISKTIFNLGDYRTEEIYETQTHEVSPRTAGPNDEYTIISETTNNE